MTIQPESVPSLIFVVIYVVLSALIGIDGHAAKWKAPGSWLLTCVLFNFGFLGYWTTDQPWKGAFDVLAGTAVTLSGPAIVYVALSVNFDRLERKYVLIPLAFSIVTLVFAGVISTLKVTDPVFGLVSDARLDCS